MKVAQQCLTKLQPLLASAAPTVGKPCYSEVASVIRQPVDAKMTQFNATVASATAIIQSNGAVAEDLPDMKDSCTIASPIVGVMHVSGLPLPLPQAACRFKCCQRFARREQAACRLSSPTRHKLASGMPLPPTSSSDPLDE